MTPTSVATRRAFISVAGAALSAPLAAGAMSLPVAAAPESLEARLARLEDLQAIQALNQAYAGQINTGTAQLPGIRRIDAANFGAHDTIEIAADRKTATARLRCTVETETAIGPDCPLVDMARQQGGGVVRDTATAVVEHACVRDAGVWRILSSALIG